MTTPSSFASTLRGRLAELPRSALIASGVVGGLALVALGVLLLSGSDKHRPSPLIEVSRPARAHRPTAQRVYPASSGTLPATVTIAFDEPHDRTRMTLTLHGLSASCPSGFRIGNPTLRILSEFKGQTRSSSTHELSVIASLSIQSSPQGVLAVSKPGVFILPGATLPTRFLKSEQTRYSSKTDGRVTTETLKFKIDTEDLLAIVAAPSVKATFGSVQIHISPSQLRDMREFAARMNPNL